MAARLPAFVTDKSVIAEGIVAVELTKPDCSSFPGWEPGAHIDVVLDEGRMERQFSLYGSPDDRGRLQIAVLREPESRGGSVWIHDSLRVGQTVAVSEPRNNFHWHPSPHYLFIAGGIGITPIIPMIAAAHAQNASWELIYGGRSRKSMAFAEFLTATYPDHVRIIAEDKEGLPDLPAILGEPRAETLVYCCGPEGLLGAVESQMEPWPSHALNVERFRPAPTGPVVNDQFEIVLASTDQRLVVSPNMSVLETLENAGMDLDCSCREGTCGECEVGVLQGDVDHRDSILSASERAANDVMFICVSRCKSDRLILDL